MTEDNFPTHRAAIDTMVRTQQTHAPEELDAIAKDVQKDTEAGSLKHFEDILDQAHSIDANPEFVTAEQREQWERDEQELLLALKRAINENLIPRGMRVTDYGTTFSPPGGRFRVKDGDGRTFDATIEWDQALQWESTVMFRKMVDTLTGRLLDSREYYFRRMGVTEVAR